MNRSVRRRLVPCVAGFYGDAKSWHRPNLRAHVERFVRTIKYECLNHYIVFGKRHLNFLVSEFIVYYDN